MRDDDRADGAIEAMGASAGFLMRGNGAVVRASTLERATVLAWYLEDACRVELVALASGLADTAPTLSVAEAEARATDRGRDLRAHVGPPDGRRPGAARVTNRFGRVTSSDARDAPARPPARPLPPSTGPSIQVSTTILPPASSLSISRCAATISSSPNVAPDPDPQRARLDLMRAARSRGVFREILGRAAVAGQVDGAGG